MTSSLPKWLLCCAIFLVTRVSPAEELDIRIAYIERVTPLPVTVSKLLLPPEDEGVQGARLGIEDNATTGKFLKHHYQISEHFISEDANWLEEVRPLVTSVDYLVVNAPSDELVALSQAEWAQGKLIFNAAAEDDELRNDTCWPNLFHTASSFSMRADALMQVLSQKKWSPILLVQGSIPADVAFASALRRAAFKFKIRITDEVLFEYNADIRRSASQEVPLLTQSEYQAVVIADANRDFGQYFQYNTWLPRPVSGDHGMMPVGFAKSMEQWGAFQLHSRFEELAGRAITSIDYWAWAAVRSIGEAVTRTQKTDVSSVRNYLLSDDFELAGFKGQALTYRDWNGQLRQPIGVVHTYATVSLPPLDVYLHQHNRMDTLGFDRPESTCKQFTEAR